MRLIPRHRQTHRAKAPRIQISQEEITADLHYRGAARPTQRELEIARRGVAR